MMRTWFLILYWTVLSLAASGCQDTCKITYVIVDHVGMQDQFAEPIVFSAVKVDTAYIHSCLSQRNAIRIPFEAHVVSCERLTNVAHALQNHGDNQQGITGDYGNFRVRIYSEKDAQPKFIYVPNLSFAIAYFERVCSDLEAAKLYIEAKALKDYLLKF